MTRSICLQCSENVSSGLSFLFCVLHLVWVGAIMHVIGHSPMTWHVFFVCLTVAHLSLEIIEGLTKNLS